MKTRRNNKKQNTKKTLEFKLDSKLIVLLVFTLLALSLLWLNLSELPAETWQKITGAVVLESGSDNNPSIGQPETSPEIIIPETNITNTSSTNTITLETNMATTEITPSPTNPEPSIAKIEQPSSGLGIQTEATSTSCGNVTTSLTLTANITTTDTCFNITASNVYLDGAGYTITGDREGFDYGVVVWDTGINYNNITIANLKIVNFNISIRDKNNPDTTHTNVTIFNNTATNNSDRVSNNSETGYSIYAENSGTNISFNNFSNILRIGYGNNPISFNIHNNHLAGINFDGGNDSVVYQNTIIAPVDTAI
ncbi:hypothetical protein HYU21_03645, partial [Candidatus Woesearchaeota archaeon]|nr:hypothetical protein [Candidatus Woesearchaeota archaeon]